ncbi:MAG: type II toxin-antitoxin system Phd/YefM family antitoxin [Actinomycetota bacterium]
MEVGIRDFRSQLSRWIEVVKSGSDVLITDRGRPVARLIPATGSRPLDRLIALGLVQPPSAPRRPIDSRRRVPVKGSVSDLVAEQRR